jgi:hypothetical protein
MGTRSLTRVFDTPTPRTSEELICVYRQYDGYPTGQGNEIFEALGDRKLVNGYGDKFTQVNGMANAAAMLICEMVRPRMDEEAIAIQLSLSYNKGSEEHIRSGRLECGNVYIYAPGTHDVGEEFEYWLFPSPDKSEIMLEVFDVPYSKTPVTVWKGSLSEFDEDTQASVMQKIEEMYEETMQEEEV